MTTRRLAAILAADVAGFSALMELDEEGTFARIGNLRREVIEPRLSEHQGRLIKTTGDGFLVEFASPIAALRCALAIQAQLTNDPDALRLRIGLNLGDVIIEESGDVYGEGVNVAARLEGLAEPGGILISDKIHREVEGKLEAVFENRGEQQVKSISRPVHVYAVHVAGSSLATSAAFPDANKPLPLPDKPSIAVLPFQNMSGDPEQDYFADGMVEDIITGPSRSKSLFVIARNSSFTFKGKAVDIKQVGRDLGVRYVLEGSVRKSGNRVRITGQLIDAVTGAHLWAERYDRKFDDLFALQDEIALAVVGAIEPSLRRAEVERVNRKRPDSLDAYDLVLRSQPDAYSGMPERATNALVLLERALALDNSYALAHAFAAMCHHNIFLRAGLHEEDRAASVRHAQAAIVHGQDDALALTFAGFSIGMDGHDHAAAFAAFEAALAVSPSSALTYILGSVIFAWAGEAERAIEWGERAMRLSPFDPWAFRRFPLVGTRAFLPRPLRRGRQCGPQGYPIQSGP